MLPRLRAGSVRSRGAGGEATPVALADRRDGVVRQLGAGLGCCGPTKITGVSAHARVQWPADSGSPRNRPADARHARPSECVCSRASSPSWPRFGPGRHPTQDLRPLPETADLPTAGKTDTGAPPPPPGRHGRARRRRLDAERFRCGYFGSTFLYEPASSCLRRRHYRSRGHAGQRRRASVVRSSIEGIRTASATASSLPLFAPDTAGPARPMRSPRVKPPDRLFRAARRRSLHASCRTSTGTPTAVCRADGAPVGRAHRVSRCGCRARVVGRSAARTCSLGAVVRRHLSLFPASSGCSAVSSRRLHDCHCADADGRS